MTRRDDDGPALAESRAALLATPTGIADELGAPRFGAYAGELARADLGMLRGSWRRGPVYRLTHHKSWRWYMVASREVLVAFALVDAGFAANGFVLAVDLTERRVLVDRGVLGIPGLSVHVGDHPNEGTRARFAARGMAVRIARPPRSSVFSLAVTADDLSLDAELDVRGAPMPLVLVAPVPGGTINVTQKAAGLAARGVARWNGRDYPLDAGVGGSDYTSGLLAHRTAWRWAFATGRADDGRVVGVNLVQGFNEGDAGSENVVWIADRPSVVGAARFMFDAADLATPWTIVTDDGKVHLTFEPIGQHREDRNLIIARSRFVQVAGTFEGTIDGGTGLVRVSGLPGVTEDQDVAW